MAAEYLSFSDWIKTWGKVTGKTVSYQEITMEQMVEQTPDKDCGLEVALMFAYSSDPGYDGGMDLLKPEDIRKVSFCFSLAADSWLWVAD